MEMNSMEKAFIGLVNEILSIDTPWSDPAEYLPAMADDWERDNAEEVA